MEEFKVLLWRFIRGFIAGAVGSMTMIGVFAGLSLTDLKSWLISLGISALAGGISGGLLALDKAVRWEKQ